MLSADTVERVRSLGGGTGPVVSLYLGLGADLDELRGVSARIKELTAPARRLVEDMERADARALAADLDTLESMGGELGRGNGMAVFLSGAQSIDERMALPLRVRDRLIVDDHPYTRPLETTLDHLHHYCAVVIDRRKASIFRFYGGDLESWEEMAEEEIRKSNYGGFSGYEEHRNRNRADEVAGRFYKDVATRLHQLLKEEDFDLLLLGGPQQHVDGLHAVVHPDLDNRLAGTFTIDPATMTPAVVGQFCQELSAAHDQGHEEALVERLFDTARSGGLAVVGLHRVLEAANQRAVDTVIIQAGQTQPGRQCSTCSWLVDTEAGLCPACGEAMRDVPDILDALSDAVRGSGGTVRNVLAATPLADDEVGAMLRYAVRVTV
ncbi:MAG: hypothetical protein KJN71_06285 [Acidimicrobiia bacterium]|nr:hypothetical protein [Acidimicrobiia bacterium]NNC74190.1 hypothetical protein [Acidimicrobiia bacterium]